jgi:hypothetical protein
MARGRTPRRFASGGDTVQALRQARARLTLGAAAVAGAATLAAYAAVSADRLGVLLGLVGGAGALLLAAALGLRQHALVAPALVLLGGEYAGLFLVDRGAVDVRAPLEGAAFLLVAELAFAALELRAGAPEPGLAARRAAAVAALALGGVVLGAVVLAAATVPLDGGLALEALGVVAAVTLLVLLGRLAARAG